MTKMRNNLILLVLLAALGACTNTQEKTKEKEETNLSPLDEVMALHDEVMPKMGSLMKVQKQLKIKADSISTQNPERAEQLRSLASDIELANEAMMNWMRNFDPNFDGTDEEKVYYFEKKRNGIRKVAELMNGSLKAGQVALD